MVLHQDTTGELSLCNKPRNFLVDEKQEPGVAALRREILAERDPRVVSVLARHWTGQEPLHTVTRGFLAIALTLTAREHATSCPLSPAFIWKQQLRY